MSDDISESTTTVEEKYPFDLLAVAFVLVAALSQYSLGALFDKTGEQVRGGIPLATLVLGVTVLVTVVRRKRIDWPVPTWMHVIFLVCISIGLFGLHRSELKSGVKEVIQVAEVFGLSWYLFATFPQRHRQRLFWIVGIIGVILIPLGIQDLHQFKPFMLSDARWAGIHLITIPFVVYLFRNRTPALAVTLLVTAVVDGLFLKNGLAFVGTLVLVTASILLLNPKISWLAGCFAILTIGLSFVELGETSVWRSFSSRRDTTYHKRLYVEAMAALEAPSHYPAGGGLGEYKRTINQLKPLLDVEVSPDENKIPKDGNSQYLLTLVEAGAPASLALLGVLLASCIGCFLKTSDEHAHVVCALACLALVVGGAFTTILGRGIGIWTGAILGLTCAIASRSETNVKESLTRFALPVGGFLMGFVVMFVVNKGERRTDHLSVMNGRLRRVLRLTPVRAETSKRTSGGLRIIKANGRPLTTKKPEGIRVEGEAFLSTTGKLKKAKSNDASQGMTLLIPLNSGKGIGKATYEVTVPKKGTYLLRARVQWEDGCSNSFRFILGNRRVTLASERFKEWHELTAHKEVQLESGIVPVIVENVEDGVRLDYFELIPIN